MNFRGAISYLEGFVHYERTPPRRRTPKTFDLEGFRFLLHYLGNPHLAFRTIHVAGTKGKGSTCAMIASILAASGKRVGLYTSPHLLSYRERIQINGRWITPAAFARHVAVVRAAIDRVGPREAVFRTTFEILTAVAFLEFAQRSVEIAVVETGLGGALDSTNVVVPTVAVLTPISRDHVAILGRSVRKIAKDKSGIIKRGCRVVIGQQSPEALAVIRDRCQGLAAPIWDLERDWKIRQVRSDLRDTRWNLHFGDVCYRNLVCQLKGDYQAENGSLAVMAVRAMPLAGGDCLAPSAIRRGLRQVSWPGRFQVMGRKRPVILDGAHNVESARRLTLAFRRLFPRKKAVLVLGVSREKDARGICRQLAPIAGQVVVTQANVARAIPARELAATASRSMKKGGMDVCCEASPKAALRLAKSLARKNQPILATGSLFLVADLLKS
jgi:dihydrofolate synthase / folylpolyglutamate synthase